MKYNMRKQISSISKKWLNFIKALIIKIRIVMELEVIVRQSESIKTYREQYPTINIKIQ